MKAHELLAVLTREPLAVTRRRLWLRPGAAQMRARVGGDRHELRLETQSLRLVLPELARAGQCCR
jgi:hypothetical protein